MVACLEFPCRRGGTELPRLTQLRGHLQPHQLDDESWVLAAFGLRFLLLGHVLAFPSFFR